MQQGAETLAFLADAVFLRHLHVLEEHHVRVDRVAAHFVDQPHLGMRAVEVGVEQGQPMGWRFTLSSGVVRASSRILLATCAVEVQILVPLMT